MSDEQTTTQELKPWKPAAGGIQSIAGKATNAVNSATPYQGLFNAPVSQYTNQGLQSFLSLIQGLPQNYGQGALQSGDYLSNKLLSGGYQPQRYDTTNAIQAAVNPLFRQFQEQTIPGINDAATVAGAYGGSQNQPGTAKNVLYDQATTDFSKALTDTAAQVDYTDYQNWRNATQEANQIEATVAGGLPSLYGQGVQAAMLPSQLWSQAGAMDQAIQQQPLNEAQQRSAYDNSFWASVLGPLNNILSGQAATFGTNTQTTELDPVTQSLSLAASLAGSLFGQGGVGNPFQTPTANFGNSSGSFAPYPTAQMPSAYPAISTGQGNTQPSQWYNPFSWG